MASFHEACIEVGFALDVFASLHLANHVSGTHVDTAPNIYWLLRLKRGVNHLNRPIPGRIISLRNRMWLRRASSGE